MAIIAYVFKYLVDLYLSKKRRGRDNSHKEENVCKDTINTYSTQDGQLYVYCYKVLLQSPRAPNRISAVALTAAMLHIQTSDIIKLKYLPLIFYYGRIRTHQFVTHQFSVGD